MDSPSDLVPATLHAIEVDYVLEQSILSKLARHDEDTVELLCKDNGPLGTFFAKIGLGYAMGLYDQEAMSCLNTIRRIRNAFVHARKDVTFATPLIRAELAAIKLPADKTTRLYKNIDLIRRLTSLDPPDPEPALTGRAAYVILCMTFVEFLLKEQSASAKRQWERFIRH